MNRVRRSTYYGTGLAAAIAAAGAAYFLDPRSGRRRRALLRDQANRIVHQSEDFLGKAGRDARQRAHGAYEKAVSRFRPGVIDDGILEERIRAELGRLSSHPGAIEVSCSKRIARLRGDILEDEVATVLHGVRRVRGVWQVVNEMRIRSEAGNVPSLQGSSDMRPAARFEYLQERWSPAPRLLAGSAGFAMIVAGLARRSAPGYAISAGGAALLARSISNTPLSYLFGVRRSAAEGVVVQKTIEVYADVDETYSRWRDLQSFPIFMSHVREVRKIDDTHYHWKVDGPADVPVEWDAEITADVPAELIAWRTMKGASVQSSGVVQFEPTSYGGTRVHMRLSYRPPENIVGHAVARIFGKDPKRQIDAGLMRFKTFIETGATPGAAAGPTRH
jgi:uncharacterized membrane protein